MPGHTVVSCYSCYVTFTKAISTGISRPQARAQLRISMGILLRRLSSFHWWELWPWLLRVPYQRSICWMMEQQPALLLMSQSAFISCYESRSRCRNRYCHWADREDLNWRSPPQLSSMAGSCPKPEPAQRSFPGPTMLKSLSSLGRGCPRCRTGGLGLAGDAIGDARPTGGHSDATCWATQPETGQQRRPR